MSSDQRLMFIRAGVIALLPSDLSEPDPRLTTAKRVQKAAEELAAERDEAEDALLDMVNAYNQVWADFLNLVKHARAMEQMLEANMPYLAARQVIESSQERLGIAELYEKADKETR